MSEARAPAPSVAEAAGDSDLSPARKWLLTVSVMVVAVMQVLDTSVTNVALPYMQGSLSATQDHGSMEGRAFDPQPWLAAHGIHV